MRQTSISLNFEREHISAYQNGLIQPTDHMGWEGGLEVGFDIASHRLQSRLTFDLYRKCDQPVH